MDDDPDFLQLQKLLVKKTKITSEEEGKKNRQKFDIEEKKLTIKLATKFSKSEVALSTGINTNTIKKWKQLNVSL